MKYWIFAILLFQCFVNVSKANEELKEVPLTAEDLKKILDLSVSKYQIDFEKPGYATLEIEVLGAKKQIVQLPSQSDSVTLMTYLERGPKSKGSSVPGDNTLHYWLSSSQNGVGSYFVIEASKTKHTRYSKADGVFSIVSKPSQEAKEVGYSLHVKREQNKLNE